MLLYTKRNVPNKKDERKIIPNDSIVFNFTEIRHVTKKHFSIFEKSLCIFFFIKCFY